MQVKVAMFALARDLVKANEVTVDIDEGSTIGDLKHVLADAHPQLKELIFRSAISVEHEFAPDAVEVKSGSQVALIPPVSGG